MLIKKFLNTLLVGVCLSANVLGMEKEVGKNSFIDNSYKNALILVGKCTKKHLLDLGCGEEEAGEKFKELQGLLDKNIASIEENCLKDFKAGERFLEILDPLLKNNNCQWNSMYAWLIGKKLEKEETLNGAERKALALFRILSEFKEEKFINGIGDGGSTRISKHRIKGLINLPDGEKDGEITEKTVNNSEIFKEILKNQTSDSILNFRWFEGKKPTEKKVKIFCANNVFRKAYHALCLIELTEIINQGMERIIKDIDSRYWFNGKAPSFKDINVNYNDPNKRIDAFLKTINFYDSFALMEQCIYKEGMKIILVHTLHEEGKPPSRISIKASPNLKDDKEVVIIIQSIEVVKSEEMKKVRKENNHNMGVFAPHFSSFTLLAMECFLTHRLYLGGEDAEDEEIKRRHQEKFFQNIDEILNIDSTLENEISSIKKGIREKFSHTVKKSINELMKKLDHEGGVGLGGFAQHLLTVTGAIKAIEAESVKEKKLDLFSTYLNKIRLSMERIKTTGDYKPGHPTHHVCTPRIIHIMAGNSKTAGDLVFSMLRFISKSIPPISPGISFSGHDELFEKFHQHLFSRKLKEKFFSEK